MGSPKLRRFSSAVVLLMAMVGALALALPAGATRLKQRRLSSHLIHRASDVNGYGELDCNGDSPAQSPVKPTMACTDVRGYNDRWNANTWTGHFYDNGNYIGHDEPDMTFYSSQSGSGNNVSWTETLPKDPSSPPTVNTPGSDVTWWFELSAAPWFSMAMCDQKSYPTTNPCTPQSDSNAPTCIGVQTTNCYGGGDAAFMEMQFYPPGFTGTEAFQDGISCDNTHWCGAMTIDSLECTLGFATCNNNCIEPVNFAFISHDGKVPVDGPPNPQEANFNTFTPNSDTLLMNPGDKITVHMFDAQVPGARRGVKAFEVVLDDLTTGKSGYMQASAANGFQNTNMSDCSGAPYNFQPLYNTAKPANIVPWAALATNISTEVEIGHFEPCTNVTGTATFTGGPGITDTYWKVCHGPYENTSSGGDNAKIEKNDSPCFPAGDTHGSVNNAPDLVTGCLDFFTQNGDLDFDGSDYWADWPTGTSPTGTYASSFAQALPTTAGNPYPQFLIQTDAALSESTCSGAAGDPGCAVPPPNAPGHFYPFWSRAGSSSSCQIEFGNVTSGVNSMGGDAQYGTNQAGTLGYPEFMGPVQDNSTCST